MAFSRSIRGGVLMIAAALLAIPTAAAAQSRRPSARAAQSTSVRIGGYGMFGSMNFTASESFEAILGSATAPIFGGGATVGLPFGGLFVDLGAWRFSNDGERVLVSGDDVVPLGIPVSITIVPIELSAGWRFRLRRQANLIPYAAGGITWYGYRETSEFSATGEDVDERFTGFHLAGGVEYRLVQWLGVAGEVVWTSIPDAIGESGVSQAFNETNLGGTSFRVKVTVGR